MASRTAVASVRAQPHPARCGEILDFAPHVTVAFSTLLFYRAAWDTVPHGIPCRSVLVLTLACLVPERMCGCARVAAQMRQCGTCLSALDADLQTVASQAVQM